MSKRPINDPEVIREILETKGKITIVGLSPKPHRDSHKVGKYLMDHGYDIIPVRPKLDEVLGQKVYPDLEAIPEPVEVVDFFVNSERVGPLVDIAIKIGAKYIWLQLGVIDEDAALRAQEAGLGVVMNKCIKIEHSRLK